MTNSVATNTLTFSQELDWRTRHPNDLHEGYHPGAGGKVGMIGYRSISTVAPASGVIGLRQADGMARASLCVYHRC